MRDLLINPQDQRTASAPSKLRAHREVLRLGWTAASAHRPSSLRSFAHTCAAASVACDGREDQSVRPTRAVVDAFSHTMVEDLRRLPSAPAPKELKSNVDDGKRQGRSRIRRHRHRKSRSEYHLALLANIVQESECGVDMHEEEIIALDDPNEFPVLSAEPSLPSQKPIEILHEESIVITENANEGICTNVVQVLDCPVFNLLPVAMKQLESEQQTHLKQAPMTKKTKKGSNRKVASSRPSKVDAIKRRTQKDVTPPILESVDSIKDHDTKDISLKCAKFLRNVQVKCNITILKPIWRCVDMPWGKDRPDISLSKLKKTMLKSLRVSAVKPLFSNTSAAGQIIA